MSGGCSSNTPVHTGGLPQDGYNGDESDANLFGAGNTLIQQNGNIVVQTGPKSWNEKENKFVGGQLTTFWGGSKAPDIGKVPNQIFPAGSTSYVHIHIKKNDGECPKYLRCDDPMCNNPAGFFGYHTPDLNPKTYQESTNYAVVQISENGLFNDSKFQLSYMVKVKDKNGNIQMMPYVGLSRLPDDRLIINEELLSKNLDRMQDSSNTLHGPNSFVTICQKFDPTRRDGTGDFKPTHKEDPFGFFGDDRMPLKVILEIYHHKTHEYTADYFEFIIHGMYNTILGGDLHLLCLMTLIEVPFEKDISGLTKFIKHLTSEHFIVDLSDKELKENATKPTFEDKFMEKKKKAEEKVTQIDVDSSNGEQGGVNEEYEVLRYTRDDVFTEEDCQEIISNIDPNKTKTIFIQILFPVNQVEVAMENKGDTKYSSVHNFLTKDERKQWDKCVEQNNAYGCVVFGYTELPESLPHIAFKNSHLFACRKETDSSDMSDGGDSEKEEKTSNGLKWTPESLLKKIDNTKEICWRKVMGEISQDGYWKRGMEPQFMKLNKNKESQANFLYQLLGGVDTMPEETKESYMKATHRSQLLDNINSLFGIHGKKSTKRRKSQSKKDSDYEPDKSETSEEETTENVPYRPANDTKTKKKYLEEAIKLDQRRNDDEDSAESSDDDDGEQSSDDDGGGEEYEPVAAGHVALMLEKLAGHIRNPKGGSIPPKDEAGTLMRGQGAGLDIIIEQLSRQMGLHEGNLRKSVRCVLNTAKQERTKWTNAKTQIRAEIISGLPLKQELKRGLEQGFSQEWVKNQRELIRKNRPCQEKLLKTAAQTYKTLKLRQEKKRAAIVSMRATTELNVTSDSAQKPGKRKRI
tara:strand:- start:1496 stop:4072 length:2577 start_codon:yes stop_codon:yes gene_type:complete